MQEPYKEMYLSLYKHMETLQQTLDTLTIEATRALLETREIYRTYLEQHIKSDEYLEKQFDNLYHS